MEFFSQIFTQRFLIYLFYKMGGLLFMVLALYLIFFVENTNFILVAILFGSSLFFSTSALKMDPKPMQVQCLQNKGFMISFFVPNAMSVAVVLMVLSLITDSSVGFDKTSMFLGSFVLLLAT
ncbi:MAG: hypothetical protein ACQESH_07965, partial [Campylobacterota bacterium]